MPTHVETLKNGLKVILRPISDTRAVSTWVVYRIGSRNEVPGMTGSTHWVEHMLFKGGGKLGKGDIDKLISRLGGKMNAFTDTDYTMYFETIPASAMEHVREAFSTLRPEAAPDPMRLAEPDQRGERRSDLVRPGPADLLSIGWHIPAAAHGDTPALILLSTVLGGWRGLLSFAAGDWHPRSNRLYHALVESKLATDAGVRQEMKLDPSLLIVSATLAKGASLDRVEQVIDREVDKLRRTVPVKAELDRAKQQVRSWARYEQDGVTFQGMLLSAGEGLSSWDFGERLLGKVEKIRGEQVREVAKTYLVDEHRSVVRFHAQGGAG